MRSKIDIIDEFKAVVRALSEKNTPFAICGGFAVVIYGYVRATKDIDLLVSAEVFATLTQLGFTLRAGIVSSRASPR